ncbi:hypothetical protein E1263_04075 [Kribbella antibiotica]|uniref:Uncharacterized protein n=1 Tax=Kribbella antibiotica TaxID=190195 RepID=A0A4R4ZTC7_9ACTN|nr:hypothetical protein [Kribbella antibiotica]TDD62341.1 hypothetical protein E1263_04075 [Kribbella antibiotica]
MSTRALTPPASLEELLLRSGSAALELSGAQQSAWNGRIVESDGDVLGLAHWDGTLHLDRESILDPVREMYALAGKHHPTPHLARYREAIATILHEHSHFLGPDGATQEAAREGFIRPGSRQLEEGVAEAWSQAHLNEYLHRLGIEKVAPGIDSFRTNGHYAPYVAAVRMLTSDLESRAALTPGTVLTALNNQTAERQFDVLSTLYYNSTRLPELEPSGPQTRLHLDYLLRKHLSTLDPLVLQPHPQATARAQAVTQTFLSQLHTEIARAESLYPPHPTHTAFAGIASPTATPPPAPGSTGLAPRSRPARNPCSMKI